MIMQNNWRNVLAWADESERVNLDKEMRWEEYDVPFSEKEAHELADKLKYVTNGLILFSWLPNVFDDRLSINGQLENANKLLLHQQEVLAELQTFYNNLLQQYPVEE